MNASRHASRLALLANKVSPQFLGPSAIAARALRPDVGRPGGSFDGSAAQFVQRRASALLL